ncbi:MAG: L-serine ammonia-lyase, iron-sulfur-dependent subunit beta [Clostridia bacterium]|jgi:L-serine dehydratase|nr:L-serine ammonia-lyase, iron-sulfur-dependent subunit beta [Clostridia bacterium]
MENFSVFDIVGPRMTGPSSSHTAGAAKIALIARRIINRPVKEVRFTLYGSFAETGRGHGTDKALIGGILGFEPDDPRIREAYKYAKSRGVLVNIIMSDEPTRHPNTVKIEACDENDRWTEVKGESIGGGNILITEIDHLEVELSGDYPTLIIRHHDEPGVIAEVSHVLAQMRLNIAFMKVFRHGKGEDAYMCIETDTEVNEGMQAILLQLCKCIRQLIVV